MQRTLTVTAITAIALLLSPLVTPVAEATNQTHCVVNVVEQLADGQLIFSEPRCYPQFSAALEDASDGTLVLPRFARGTLLFDDSSLALAASSFTLGIHFDGYGGSGSSITVVGTSCSGGWWNTGTAWKDRISSSYNGCSRLRHYDYANRSGSFEDTVGAGTTDNLLVLNNRAESVSYH